jgi:hypothetical protein
MIVDMSLETLRPEGCLATRLVATSAIKRTITTRSFDGPLPVPIH